MATWQHLRSSTANKRPTTSLADGRIAINTNTASPGLFFKDSAGTGLVKVGPVHVGTTAPNSVPAAGGSSGNYTGEQWLDTSVSPAQMKVWNGSTWVGIVADELPVSKLQDGAARQLIQTDAAGTGVEWTSNIDVPGTLDVTSTATFDSIAQYPAGSAAAPTITFTGDTNTGIYSPGADQVAISTSGAQRLVVDASGNIYQSGSSSDPFGRFDDRMFAVNASSASDNAALSVNAGSTAGRGGQVYLGQGGTRHLTLAGNNSESTVGTASNTPLKFATGDTERLRITSAGLVGVGVSSVGAQLEVQRTSATDPALRLRYNSTSYYADHLMDGNGNYIIYSPAANGVTSGNLRLRAGTSFAVSTNDQPATSPALFIDASQRVGIGTSSPARRLVVAGDTNTVCAVQGSNIGTSSVFLGDTDDESIGAFTYNHVSNYLEVKVNGAERVRVDSSGRVGIGTTSPTETLNVVGGNIKVDSSARRIGYWEASSVNDGYIVPYTAAGEFEINNTFNNGAITFRTGTARSERARIDSSGRLLVGTSTAQGDFTLQIQGDAAGSSAAGSIYLRRGLNTAAIGGNVGADLGSIDFGANDGTIAGRIECLSDATWSSTSDTPGRLVFSTTADGASSPTEQVKIDSAGYLYSYQAYAGTTGSAANVVVLSNGAFIRSTSSAKYKTQIEDLQAQYADALLACRPVWYRSTCTADNPNHSYWGFIAEEVAEIDPRLVHWKTVEINYDEKGSAVETPCEPEPEGVAYDRFVPHLLNLIKRQKEQIEAMETRLSALEAA